LTLTRALASLDDVDLLVVRNTRRGVSRYPQTVLRVAWGRLRHRPHVWIVGFRGHEIFPLIYPLMAGANIVFDEFVNLHGWLVDERRFVSARAPLTRALDALVRWIMERAAVILSDTDAQADYSSAVYRVPRTKFRIVPVGADESMFFPRQHVPRVDGRLEVLFFGTMLPLHGTNVLLDAIRILHRDGLLKAVHFTLIGGRGRAREVERLAAFAQELHEGVTHLPWVDYAKLPGYVAAADLCVGGPLGNTPQARRVITGKTFQFLAMGRPTLIGEVDAANEFVDRDNCLLVRQGSAEAVAEAVAWAATHRDELEEIGRRGRVYFDRCFSIAHVGEAVRAALEG
jgi:glycosyltransferase involved in cell wall biosynthesis